jgi:hypothetical protein
MIEQGIVLAATSLYIERREISDPELFGADRRRSVLPI